MLRRSFVAALVLFVLGGFVLAETVRGVITAIEGDKIKVTVRKKGEKEGEPKEFTISDKTEFHKAKSKDDSEKVTKEDAIKAIKAAKKGAAASLEVEDGKVSKITFFSARKKKGT